MSDDVPAVPVTHEPRKLWDREEHATLASVARQIATDAARQRAESTYKRAAKDARPT